MNKIRALVTISMFFPIVLSACGIVTSQPTPLPTFIPSPTPTLSILTDTFTIKSTQSEQSNSTNACTISTENTYGYTSKNPIKVGDRDFGGRLPELKFLENLSGPNGEWLSYEKIDTLQFGDIILDVFDVTGLNKKVTLYIDTHSFSELQAPVGFTCYGRFSD
jgi:hypothetical protein